MSTRSDTTDPKIVCVPSRPPPPPPSADQHGNKIHLRLKSEATNLGWQGCMVSSFLFTEESAAARHRKCCPATSLPSTKAFLFIYLFILVSSPLRASSSSLLHSIDGPGSWIMTSGVALVNTCPAASLKVGFYLRLRERFIKELPPGHGAQRGRSGTPSRLWTSSCGSNSVCGRNNTLTSAGHDNTGCRATAERRSLIDFLWINTLNEFNFSFDHRGGNYYYCYITNHWLFASFYCIQCNSQVIFWWWKTPSKLKVKTHLEVITTLPNTEGVSNSAADFF